MKKQSDNKDIGSRIGGRIKELGLSQAALAGHLGIRQSAVSHWIRGANAPKNIDQIAEFLQTTTDYLLYGTGSKERIQAGLAKTSKSLPTKPDDPLEEALQARIQIQRIVQALTPEARQCLHHELPAMVMQIYDSVGLQTPKHENLDLPLKKTNSR